MATTGTVQKKLGQVYGKFSYSCIVLFFILNKVKMKGDGVGWVWVEEGIIAARSFHQWSINIVVSRSLVVYYYENSNHSDSPWFGLEKSRPRSWFCRNHTINVFQQFDIFSL